MMMIDEDDEPIFIRRIQELDAKLKMTLMVMLLNFLIFKWSSL